MIQLLLMLAIGLSLLVFSLFVLVRGSRANTANSAASDSELSNMLRLTSLEFDNAALLFADTDYRVFLSEPRLRPLARELWQDRKRIALAWLGECERDVVSMWRFRRFLTSQGASNGAREDLSAAFQLLGLMSLLAVLRVSVWLWGPYAFTRAVLRIRAHARKLRRSCARMLERLPREKWAQVAAEWEGAQAAH